MNIPINRGAKLPPKRTHLVNAGTFAGPCVFTESRIWGTGNPKTTGATRGERYVVSRRNVSKFTVIGTAHVSSN